MNHVIRFYVIFFAVAAFCVLHARAQERLRPGVIYKPGQQISAPRVGLTAVIPEGWDAVLPQDTELLLLMNQENPDGSIFAVANELTEGELLSRLDINLDVGNNIQLARKGELINRGDVLATELQVIGSTNTKTGYLEAKCSEFGWCVTYMLVCSPDYYESFKKGLMDFMNTTVLNEPSLGSIYDQFDWSEFLSSKYLATYISNPYVKKNNQVWLCPDGTFKSKIQQKGLGDIPKEYKGSKSGTYQVQGKGSTGELILHFQKGEPISVKAEIREDKIYLNGNRFYAMENKECK
jgi:hypothetical protein